MHLTTSRFAEALSAIRAGPLALHLARTPIRGSASRLRPVCMALVGRPKAVLHERPAHDPTLMIRAVYDTHLKMRGLLEVMAELRGDPA